MAESRHRHKHAHHQGAHPTNVRNEQKNSGRKAGLILAIFVGLLGLAVAFFAVGTTAVTCTSSAGPTCTFNVTVNDTQGPSITLNGNVITLWPPNHQYETVKVSDLVASASDNCDTGVDLSSVFISQVTSDEVENGDGDGDTLNDIVIAPDCKSVQLRSERSGNANGRVYTITFKVIDASGNMATATATVTVPKSQNGSAAVDDGPQYTVLGGCP